MRDETESMRRKGAVRFGERATNRRGYEGQRIPPCEGESSVCPANE